MTLLVGAVAMLLVALIFAPLLLMLLFSAMLVLIDLLIIIPLRVIFALLTFPTKLLIFIGGVLWAAATSAWDKFSRGR